MTFFSSLSFFFSPFNRNERTISSLFVRFASRNGEQEFRFVGMKRKKGRVGFEERAREIFEAYTVLGRGERGGVQRFPSLSCIDFRGPCHEVQGRLFCLKSDFNFSLPSWKARLFSVEKARCSVMYEILAWKIRQVENRGNISLIKGSGKVSS